MDVKRNGGSGNALIDKRVNNSFDCLTEKFLVVVDCRECSVDGWMGSTFNIVQVGSCCIVVHWLNQLLTEFMKSERGKEGGLICSSRDRWW